jgi:hypothetical protein
MIKIFNDLYYIDLDEIENVVNLEVVETSGGTKEQQIKFVRYDIIKMMLEVILTERDDESADDMIPSKSSSTSLPFKFSFNTLLFNKIIKKY